MFMIFNTMNLITNDCRHISAASTQNSVLRENLMLIQFDLFAHHYIELIAKISFIDDNKHFFCECEFYFYIRSKGNESDKSDFYRLPRMN